MPKKENLRYIDLHSDTITVLNFPKENLEKNKRAVSIPDMDKGGTLAQCFSAFIPTGFYPKPVRDRLVWKRFCAIADKKDRLLSLHSDKLVPILNRNDFEECKRNGKIGVIFTIEDLGIIGNDPQKLKTAYNRGIRIASITWNHENSLAFPNSQNEKVMQRGLKPFGFEAIEEMNRLGMVIDVSHLSDGGFWDIAKVSKGPFIATHSNSRSVTNHPRNLTDDMIRTVAENGGVIGLNFAPGFLSERNDKQSRIEDMTRHILHIRKIGGSDVLAIGTDFDGIHGKLEISTPAAMPLLFEMLKKAGLAEAEIENMCRNNVMRVVKEVW